MRKYACHRRCYEYGRHAGLGLVPGRVCPLAPDLADPALKVPQIGWNALELLRPQDPLFRYLRQGEYVPHLSAIRNWNASRFSGSPRTQPTTQPSRA